MNHVSSPDLQSWSPFLESERDVESKDTVRQTFNISDYHKSQTLMSLEASDQQSDQQFNVADTYSYSSLTDARPERDDLTQQINESTATLNDRGRFQIGNPIGEGSFGKVWSVTDQELSRAVALKTFKGDSQFAKAAYNAEIRLAGKLDHPSIPTIYHTGLTPQGQPYVMMKLLKGESLEAIINQLRTGSPEIHERYSFIRRAELMIQLLRILVSIHRNGVLHRDIKPENILVDLDGNLFLIDWGCAIELSEVTESSVPAGTPMFMPPEQVRGSGLSPASDLFAFAGVAYEFFSLQTAMSPEGTLREVLSRIFTHRPAPFDQIPQPVQGYAPSEFAPIVMRSLEREPHERPQSAEELLEYFQRALEGHIEIVCPRTRLKSLLYRILRSLDKSPYKTVQRTYLALFGSVTALLLLGVALGKWLL